MVWSKGAWFIFSKPFIFKKWTSHFSPERDEYSNVPIWFKIHDLQLCCWTPVGISKIATKIGIPLAVDALTASKSRLTYARVYVQVDSTATYPAIVPITVERKLFNLRIQYEWRPSICNLYKSFNHQAISCPSNPNPKPSLPPTISRGRRTSRRPRPPSTNPTGILPNPNIPTEPLHALTQDIAPPPKDVVIPSSNILLSYIETRPNSQIPPPTNSSTLPESAPTAVIPYITETSHPQQNSVTIPNLNSPTLPSSSSSDLPPPPHIPPPKMLSPNKFSILQSLSDSETASNIEPEPEPDDHLLQTKLGTSSPLSSYKPNTSQPSTTPQSQRNIRGKGAKKGPKTKNNHP
ncbi:proline-rich receptor-like protein kinase PERK9 [Dendrobium catenatum]|uniref:proline-rich receptor-like protein kinase PERK9 n=1 Tax=Dendrobium catenatum TaxID=906689 RepID=UPI0009F4F31C|nr:proline-rich receptor-like protein kinase PERK9 [Dendrobium catenatum]